ncbi:MAG TPA: hypothetical protein VGC54_02490 [Planctomycetota bacterium]
MKASVAAASLVLFLATTPAGQEPAPDPVAKELAGLLARHESSELSYPEAYRAFLPRVQAFAEEHRGTEPEVRAVLWLIQNTWWLREAGAMESTAMPLAQDLLARHLDSPQLDLLGEYRYVFTKEQQRTLYARLIAESPHRHVQAAAVFGLALASPARSATGLPNPHLVTLLEDYADVRWRQTTFGRIADAHLNPLSAADLAVGRKAPEIEGIDQDGKPLKLSDFRGKVVLLDFWGDW